MPLWWFWTNNPTSIIQGVVLIGLFKWRKDMHTVIQLLSNKDKAGNNGENFYLNHAYIKSAQFGSADMMWTGSHEEATAMLKHVKAKHAGKRLRFAIEEV